MILNWLKTIIKITVSVLLIWWILLGVDYNIILTQLGQIWLPGLLIIIVAFVFLAALQAWRWCMVMAVINQPIKLVRSINLTMLGLFFNQTLPSTIGGDGIKIWHLCKSGISLKSATSGVMADRLLALFTLVFMSAVALPFIYVIYGNILAFYMVLVVALAGLFGFVVLLNFNKIPKLLLKLKLLRGLLSVAEAFKLVLKSKRIALLAIINSLFLHISTAILVFYMGYLVGSDIGFMNSLLVFPAIFLISSIPISIAGWGVREGAMVVGFASIGISEVGIISVSLLFGFCMLILGFVGGAWWLLVKK